MSISFNHVNRVIVTFLIFCFLLLIFFTLIFTNFHVGAMELSVS